ncbi:MAG: serine/threonine protein kinase [Myxococcales bacterium]|nr:serine/threonine protein kinase [Myxococcales bacterium]
MSEERLGRYRVDGELGRGGMSVVYRGHDPVLDRPVAIKVLHPHLASRDDSRSRFTREAKAVARLKHPSIVEVYDYAPPDSDRAYIVTELIEGPTLRAFVETHPLKHSEVSALLMVPIFEALAHAHANGIVHRDVKPENIMLRRDGTPVLMDFGIASMVDTETLTATGTMLGSPAHMAPEVVEGEPLTTQADLFSAGTVLYWMVCGALPFSGPTPAALFRRILESRFDPVLKRRPQAGRAIARLIEQCMARNVADRPGSAVEVAQALRRLLSDAGLDTVRPQLTQLFKDPSVYQDELGRALVPRYVKAARVAFEAGLTGRAIDFLDRVLAIDDEHAEGRALLSRIERGQRRGAIGRIAAVVAAVLAVGLGGWWLWGGATPAPVEPRADRGLLSRAAPADAAPRTPNPAADAGVDAAPHDGALVSEPGDRGPPQDAADPDGGRPIARRRRPPRLPTSRPPSQPASVAMSAPAPPTPVQVPVKGGPYKATKVLVNRRPRGYIYEIERDGGLKLPPGRHTFRFENPACRPFETTIVVDQRSPRGPTVVFECTLKPAIIHITAGRDVEVRAPDGRVIGRTNQDFPVTMSQRFSELRLTLGDPGDRLPTLPVKLFAGQRIVKEVDF